MLDFKQELAALLQEETQPPAGDAIGESLRAMAQVVEGLSKKQTDISLQMEELYETVNEWDNAVLQQTLADEKKRGQALLQTVVSFCDMVENFCAFAVSCKEEELSLQGAMMWRETKLLLERIGVTLLDQAGGPLDPSIHRVQSAEASAHYPPEYVTRVLQSGYRYNGEVLRKAAVVISKGKGQSEKEEDEYGAHHWN